MHRLAGTTLAAAFALAACQPPVPPLVEHDYPNWGFKVSFPSQPTEVTQAGLLDGSQGPSLAADAASPTDGPTRDFSVWAADVSQAKRTFDQLASNASQHVAKGLGDDVGAQTYVATSEGVQGREFALTKNGKWTGVLRVFLAGGKFYEVLAQSVYGADDPPVQAFLGSFHIVAASAPATVNATPPG
jgi:hypothetical protein